MAQVRKTTHSRRSGSARCGAEAVVREEGSLAPALSCRPGQAERRSGTHTHREWFDEDSELPPSVRTTPWEYGSRIGARLRARLSGTTAEGGVAAMAAPP